MNKIFIDYLYNLKHLVENDIEKLSELSKQPRTQCCDNMPMHNESEAELRTRRSQLGSIDETIERYLKYHFYITK